MAVPGAAAAPQAPAGRGQAPAPRVAAQPQPRASQPRATPRPTKPGLLQRIFPFGRKSARTQPAPRQQVAHPQTRPARRKPSLLPGFLTRNRNQPQAPVQQQVQQPVQRPQQVEPQQALPQLRVPVQEAVVRQPFPSAQGREAGAPPAPNPPGLTLPPTPGPAPVAAQPSQVRQPLLTTTPDLGNPFPELSENEADNSTEPVDSPFSGRSLDDSDVVTADQPAEPEVRSIPLDVPETKPEPVAEPTPEADPFSRTAEADSNEPELKPIPADFEPSTRISTPATTAQSEPSVDASVPATSSQVTDAAHDSESPTWRKTQPRTAETETKTGTDAGFVDVKSREARLAARREQSGLKGFCPVELRNSRKLVDSRAEFTATWQKRTYQFSSAEALAEFEKDPARYAPVASGYDVIVLGNSGERIDGSLDHAVWYHDRLHLFSSRDTLQTFVETLNSVAPASSEK